MSTVELSFSLSNPLSLASAGSVANTCLNSLWPPDLAMDLGTANTLVYARGRGIILNEPSMVAYDNDRRRPIAIGHKAKEMYGKTHASIRCVRPMKNGVIGDFDMAQSLIGSLLRRVTPRLAVRRPRIVIGVPTGITPIEKSAVIDAAMSSGASKVFLIEQSIAAALGADLPIERPVANMVVDIGGGSTEVAVLSLQKTVSAMSLRVGGDQMDEAVQKMLRRVYGLEIGIIEAERIKIVMGSALPFQRERKMAAYGRDIASGVPQAREISSEDIREALEEPVTAIVSSIITVLEGVSPELALDIGARGIYLTGGGAMLKGLLERVQNEIGMRIMRAADPLSCVVRGAGQVVERLKENRHLCTV
jgi:rod shape-determining protein MreB and related proteins